MIKENWIIPILTIFNTILLIVLFILYMVHMFPKNEQAELLFIENYSKSFFDSNTEYTTFYIYETSRSKKTPYSGKFTIKIREDEPAKLPMSIIVTDKNDRELSRTSFTGTKKSIITFYSEVAGDLKLKYKTSDSEYYLERIDVLFD